MALESKGKFRLGLTLDNFCGKQVGQCGHMNVFVRVTAELDPFRRGKGKLDERARIHRRARLTAPPRALPAILVARQLDEGVFELHEHGAPGEIANRPEPAGIGRIAPLGEDLFQFRRQPESPGVIVRAALAHQLAPQFKDWPRRQRGKAKSQEAIEGRA